MRSRSEPVTALSPAAMWRLADVIEVHGASVGMDALGRASFLARFDRVPRIEPQYIDWALEWRRQEAQGNGHG